MSDLANRLVTAADAKLEELYLADGAVSHATAARWVTVAVLRELAKGTFLLRPDSPGTSGFVTAGEVRVELDRLAGVVERRK